MARSGSVSGASTSYSTTIASSARRHVSGMVGSDRRDRLADVADDVAGEHRLIAADQPVGRLAGHIVGRDDGRDAVDAPRRCDVDAHDPRRTDAASAALLPRGSRRPTGHPRTRTSPAPWRCRRVAPGCRRADHPATADDTLPSGRAHCRSPLGRDLATPLADRFDDSPVAGAAADVAGQLLADLGVGRLRVCVRAGRVPP